MNENSLIEKALLAHAAQCEKEARYAKYKGVLFAEFRAGLWAEARQAKDLAVRYGRMADAGQ